MEVKHLAHKGQVHLLQTQKNTFISEYTITFLTHILKNVSKNRQISGRPSTIPTTGQTRLAERTNPYCGAP